MENNPFKFIHQIKQFITLDTVDDPADWDEVAKLESDEMIRHFLSIIVDKTNEIVKVLRVLWSRGEINKVKYYIKEMTDFGNGIEYNITPIEGQALASHIFNNLTKYDKGVFKDLTIYQQFFIANLAMLIDSTKLLK